MKIEKLRNNHKKEIIIGTILTVVIGGALTFKLTHSKYRTTQSIDLATGTINYTVPDFKIMAMYKNDGSGDVSIDSMPTSGYVINESKTYCQTSSGSQVKGKIKTENGKHVISELTKGDKCYLYFDKVITIDNIIAGLNAKTSTPTFSSVATTDEGVFQTSDGMYGGTTYYWRGAVTNNYVKFAGYCWRIVRINGDKTLRLIYDGTTCHANGTNTTENLAVTGQAYNSNYNKSNYVGWTYDGDLQRTLSGTPSNAKLQIDSWYNSHIGNNATYSAKVADGKFCNDRDTRAGGSTGWVSTGASFYYAGYGRLRDNKNPTFSCANAGDVYTIKVALITADEVAFAGGVYNINNTSYYLYNGQIYWTMSPFQWDSGAYMYFVNSSGELYHWNYVNGAFGLRPVINLKADTTFASGDGTQNSPYTVS